MAKFYALRIKQGKMELGEVHSRWLEDVKEILRQDEEWMRDHSEELEG